MKSKTTWILLLGLVVCFGYLGIRKLVKSVPKPAAESKKLFAIEPQYVSAVTITPANKPSIKFVKKNDKWKIAQPIDTNAQQWQVESLLRELSTLEYASVYKDDDPQKPGDDLTGLNKPRWTVTIEDVAGKTESIIVADDIPLSGANKVYAAVKDRNDVFVIDMNLSEKLSKPVSDYRDKTMLELDRDSINKIQIEGPQSYTIEKTGNDWTITALEKEPAKKDQVDKIISGLTNISAEKFIDDDPKNLTIYGLDKGNEQVIVKVWTTSKGTHTLLFGTARDQKVFAKLADKKTIFQLSESDMKKFTVDPKDIIKEPETKPDEKK